MHGALFRGRRRRHTQPASARDIVMWMYVCAHVRVHACVETITGGRQRSLTNDGDGRGVSSRTSPHTFLLSFFAFFSSSLSSIRFWVRTVLYAEGRNGDAIRADGKDATVRAN